MGLGPSSPNPWELTLFICRVLEQSKRQICTSLINTVPLVVLSRSLHSLVLCSGGTCKLYTGRYAPSDDAVKFTCQMAPLAAARTVWSSLCLCFLIRYSRREPRALFCLSDNTRGEIEKQRERDCVYVFRKSLVSELLTSRPLITAFPTILWLLVLPVSEFEVFHLDVSKHVCNTLRKPSVSFPGRHMLQLCSQDFSSRCSDIKEKTVLFSISEIILWFFIFNSLSFL